MQSHYKKWFCSKKSESIRKVVHFSYLGSKFVGKDVAEALGYKNTNDVLSKRVSFEDKMSGVAIYDSMGRTQCPVWIDTNSQGVVENEDYTSVLTGTQVRSVKAI